MAERSLSAAAVAGLLQHGASGRGPAYQQLAQGLRQAVLDGRAPLGARLPAERDLAGALGISRTTVGAAYDVLREAGFIVTRRGARAVTALPTGASWPGPLPDDPAQTGLLDLAYATLPAPEGVLHRAYAAALEALPAHLPGHGYSAQGLGALREVIAGRYAARGLPTGAGQILVTFGAQHAFGLLVRALTAPGDRVLVDHPTYPHALEALRQASCRAVPVALLQTGWDDVALRAALRQTAPRLAYLIPDFHNPTGHCMPAAVRASVARAAAQARTTLVIDETLADLALDVPAPAPFAVQAGLAEVVSTGSLSKSCWGGLRLGWIRAPEALMPRLLAVRAALDQGAPILEQLAAVALLTNDGPVLETRREVLRRQRAALMDALTRHLPEWRYHVPPGGLSLWVTLPGPFSSALAARAERFGVRVAAGPRFSADGLLERHLRLPYTLPEPELAEAIRRLARAASALGTWDGDAAADDRAPTALI